MNVRLSPARMEELVKMVKSHLLAFAHLVGQEKLVKLVRRTSLQTLSNRFALGKKLPCCCSESQSTSTCLLSSC